MAATKGFYMMMRNAIRFGLVTAIGDVIVFLGEVLVSSLGALATYCILNVYTDLKSELYYLYGPVIFIAIIGYAVGSIFMHVYG
jgi:hypothetical protein